MSPNRNEQIILTGISSSPLTWQGLRDQQKPCLTLTSVRVVRLASEAVSKQNPLVSTVVRQPKQFIGESPHRHLWARGTGDGQGMVTILINKQPDVINLYKTLKLMLIMVCFFFSWTRCTACGILVPWPATEPAPSSVKARSPNHWTDREFPCNVYFLNMHKNPGPKSPALCKLILKLRLRKVLNS